MSLAVWCGGVALAQAGGPPPSSVGVYPLSQVHRGQHGTAWTVFEGSVPEPMDVEILGVLRGARGPGRDLILARLHGDKPEYTGVVAGMSGSPVYVEGKLLGALSYRIGQFTKEPIAGITPMEQMLEVRDLPMQGAAGDRMSADPSASSPRPSEASGDGMSFTAMDTPLLMSGFSPAAVQLWKQRVAGTGLDVVSAGGGLGSGSSASGSEGDDTPLVPGSAVSLQLVRGDLEIAATCTVTYIDPKQLLACGHPVMQSGTISLPMTKADVVATLASPLNSFKIVNTGREIGAFTEDRDAAIRGELGAKAKMIPVRLLITGVDGDAGAGKAVERKMEVLDLPSLTVSALLVSVYQTLLETNQSTGRMSYHVTGSIHVHGSEAVPVDAWGTPSEQMASQLSAAFAVGDAFNRLYNNGSRTARVESVQLRIEPIAGDLRTELESVRLVSSGIVHAGDTLMAEATVRPWGQAARNVRMPITIPAWLPPGTLRILVSGAATLDRTLDAARASNRPPTEAAAMTRLRGLHAGDRLYVSLLLPESQASLEGATLAGLPLSMSNTLEPERSGLEAGLHGESLVVVAERNAGGVVSGQQLLSVHIEPGGGLH